MDDRYARLKHAIPLDAILGYLNFSEGKPDPRVQKQVNDAYAWLAQDGAGEPWAELPAALRARLGELHTGGASAFKKQDQAENVLRLAFTQVLPAYRRHHADLLFHLSDAELFQPFFLVRVLEAVLTQGPPWNEDERLVAGAIAQLNDYVGHRPIAVLESRPRGEPYDHEKVRPIPLYLRGAGVAWGRYHDLLERALDILRSTDPAILHEASFDPELLDELALDPRAYDQGHPVNRRSNYVFGEWDPHHLDLQGRYRRFVVRRVTLDALLDRVETERSFDELLFEAAAVLAGTILMASGICGGSPETHDSTVTLAKLIPRVARYRDAFYQSLLLRVDANHARRLQEEMTRTRQPFGAARQHLNHYLARYGAAQLQRQHLALLFAEMGYPEASRRQAFQIPAASVRMLSEIQIRLTTGRLAVERGELSDAAGLLPEIEDLLHRGIACGALADPWNILGFQALFPLFHAQEDSVRDTRIDALIDGVAEVFALYDRLLSEAGGRGERDLIKRLIGPLRNFGRWWDRFASVEVSGVRHVHGSAAVDAAFHVASALTQWHERGTASADLAFWRERQESFTSPQAFARVVDALLRKDDYRAAMALLVTWLGQSEQVPLEDGEYSFHQLSLRWLLGIVQRQGDDPWPLVVKFLDYLEANAEDYWQVPRLELNTARPAKRDDSLFEAAYEDVTYQDTTDDEQEGSVAEGGPHQDEFALELEAPGLEKRLAFLATVGRLWHIAAQGRPATALELTAWLATARTNQLQLLELLDALHGYSVPEPSGTYDALVEFDRRRRLKEHLLNRTVDSCLSTFLAVSTLQGTLGDKAYSADAPGWTPVAVRLEQALLRGDADGVRAALPDFIQRFHSEPLAFRSLSAGGEPRKVLRARTAQHILRALAAALPRLGLLRETIELLRTARKMEDAQPAGPHGVTQFNELFHTGCHALADAVVAAGVYDGAELAEALKKLAAPGMALWVEHSRTMQLSALESLRTERAWGELRAFVQAYGGDLFKTMFLALGNLRGILQRGVGAYLDYLRDNPDPLHPVRLIDDLDRAIPRDRAVQLLEVVLQALVENYAEYKDYNATTTQSDYGENLHMLLDFLALKAGYDRHFWVLRPLVWMHEVLVRTFHYDAADRWRREYEQFQQPAAEEYLRRLAALEQAHGMRLQTISDRVQERFVRPLDLDRLCGLVEPAMAEASALRGSPDPAGHFDRLEAELRPYADRPSGVGLDVPPWLTRLELEVHRVRAKRSSLAVLAESWLQIPRRRLSREELEKQLTA